MTNSENVYEFVELDRLPIVRTRYLFVSQGKRRIVKVVEYEYIGLREDRLAYNLGFGTYNHDTGKVQDDDISDNDDHYKVFNTVLSTISLFLNNCPNAIVMVEGSDSATTYPETCRPNCKKKCIPPICKNAHRRINIYKNFVNKNFTQLSQNYQFWGSIKDDENQVVMEEYKTINKYDSVFFIKK